MPDIVAVVIENPEQPIKAILAPGIGEVAAAVISQIGPPGLSGYSGFSGDGGSGFSGYSGFCGISGYSGFSGGTGTDGQSGYSGFSGKSGYSGFCGLSGYSGYSGTGTSGYSGFSGGGGTSLLEFEVARVDASGNDGTGTVGDLGKPFLTVQAAINAIEAGSFSNPLIDIGNNSFAEDLTTSLAFISFKGDHPYNVLCNSLTFTEPTDFVEVDFFSLAHYGLTTFSTDGGIFILVSSGATLGSFNVAGDFEIESDGAGLIQGTITLSTSDSITITNFYQLENDITIVAGTGSFTANFSRISAVTSAVSTTLKDSRIIGSDGSSATIISDVFLKQQMSITRNNAGFKLVNDETTPGASKVYGTDGAGAKGWQAGGTSGYSGFCGLSGYSGYCGLSGYSGFSGDPAQQSGYSGFCGASGYSGFSGSPAQQSGYSGFCGLSGYSGFCGLSGYSGFCGLSGYSGFCGLSGYSGFCGLSGYSGFSGAGAAANKISYIQNFPLADAAPVLIGVLTATGTTAASAAANPFGSSLSLQRLYIPGAMSLTEVDLAFGVSFPATNQGQGSISQSFIVYSFGNSTSLASVLSASRAVTWATGTTTAGTSSSLQQGWASNNIQPFTFASTVLPAGEYAVGHLMSWAAASTSWTISVYGNQGISPIQLRSEAILAGSVHTGSTSTNVTVWSAAPTNVAVVASSNSGQLTAITAITQNATNNVSWFVSRATSGTTSVASATSSFTFLEAPFVGSIATSAFLGAATNAAGVNVFAAAGTAAMSFLSSAGLSAGSFITGSTAITAASISLPSFAYNGSFAMTTATSDASYLSGQFLQGIFKSGSAPTAIDMRSTAMTVTGSVALVQPWFALLGS